MLIGLAAKERIGQTDELTEVEEAVLGQQKWETYFVFFCAFGLTKTAIVCKGKQSGSKSIHCRHEGVWQVQAHNFEAHLKIYMKHGQEATSS